MEHHDRRIGSLGKRRLLVSIHDVSPRFETDTDLLLDLVGPVSDGRLAMLVVPDFWSDAPLVPGSPFASRLRAWAEAGVEMFLHGFTHRNDRQATSTFDRLRARHMTAGEGEFLSLSTDEAVHRIIDGQALVEDIIGVPITGFVAPAWLYGAGAREALAQCRMALAEDHWRVWSPASGQVLSRSPVITWASRSRARRASSLLVANAVRQLPMPATMRLAVHPGDVRHDNLRHSIAATLRALAATHRPARYADLLAR